MANKPEPMPLHYWQIHKKVYNREFINLDYVSRREILADTGGDAAMAFYSYVKRQAVKFFEDETHNYNSRHRFQYEQ
tara:strand:+ start:1185 stop:1415 length:231 start_codon:yes stop_codon:yes gene_type:complete